jgi:hypothetical protein
VSIEAIAMTRWMELFTAKANALVGGITGVDAV